MKMVILDYLYIEFLIKVSTILTWLISFDESLKKKYLRKKSHVEV